jgi:formamidopyrimidine-DNA glycosylase
MSEMPALVELEVVRRDLEREVVGRRIKDAEVRPGSNAMKIIKRHGRRKEFQDLLVGARFDGVERFGTWLVLELDTQDALVIDLGRAGRLFKTSSSEQLAAYTHIVIGFTIGGQLRLSDPALGGEVFVAAREGLEQLDGRVQAAIDPFKAPLSWRQLSGLLEDQKRHMKDLLTDNSFICGLGDIYSDEILFAAGLRYDRMSHDLSAQDVRRLYRSLQEILQEAVKARGTSCPDHEFVDLQGEPGEYQAELKVFNRLGEACRRCRTAIERTSWGPDYTYFCPQCQS